MNKYENKEEYLKLYKEHLSDVCEEFIHKSEEIDDSKPVPGEILKQLRLDFSINTYLSISSSQAYIIPILSSSIVNFPSIKLDVNDILQQLLPLFKDHQDSLYILVFSSLSSQIHLRTNYSTSCSRTML